MTAAPKIECSTCGGCGEDLDEGLRIPCRTCCCADCGEQVGFVALVKHDGRSVCPACKPATCASCGNATKLAALDDDDNCEECHVDDERVEGPTTAGEAFHGW